MLHIFLVILKILGIALLVILGLLISLLLMVLFIPVKYRILLKVFEKKETVSVYGDARVSFLGPVFRINIEYKEELYWDFKLFGFLLKCSDDIENGDSDNFFAEFMDDDDFPFEGLSDYNDDYLFSSVSEKEKSDKSDFAEKQNDYNAYKKDRDVKNKINNNNNRRESNNDKRQTRSYSASAKSTVNSIKKMFAKIKSIYKEINKLLIDDRFKTSYNLIKSKLLFVFKKSMPFIKKAEFKFGTDDPALTGIILGGIAAFNGFTGQAVIAEPDFEADRVFINGEADLKGKIKMIHFLNLFWSYYFNKEVKYFKYKIGKIRRRL